MDRDEQFAHLARSTACGPVGTTGTACQQGIVVSTHFDGVSNHSVTRACPGILTSDTPVLERLV